MLKSFLPLVLMCFVLGSVGAARAQDPGPEELVRKVTAEVLEAVKGDKQLQAGDRRKALALAEETILPLVDFEEATRLAVGRAWRDATPEQRKQLVTEFRRMLVRIYSNSLGVYRGQTMKVLPVRMAPGAAEATVRNEYIRPGKPPATVDYAMRKTGEGWKIYDIVAEGISLVITYRGEFEQAVRKSGIDGLIRQMAEKNAAAT